MFKRRLIVGLAVLTAFVVGAQTNFLALNKKKQAKFKVRIENISGADGFPAADGSKYPFALSPGLYALSAKKQRFLKLGKKAGAGLEAQAEDGNPDRLSKELALKVGSINLGIFNTPVGGGMPGPLLPGGAYEFSFTAEEGTKLYLIAMYAQSNDLFYAPEQAIELFQNGEAISGDITGRLLLWDAGTEVNQAPGIGDEQAPRQKAVNSGKAENGVIGLVKDSFTYPSTAEVLRVTISHD